VEVRGHARQHFYTMKTHELKTWPEHFDKVWKWEKNFEVRLNDRDFQVGDTLILKEWDNVKQVYTGKYLHKKVRYILHGGKFGIEPGHVVMSIY
jgi:hypothetical protein